jgi:hypothetical protein
VTESEKPPSATAKAASILLALLPPARMAWIVFTNGENNLSNDYIARAPLVGLMIDGKCSLGTFVREAWIGSGHSTLAVVPIYYLNAWFFDWSVWVEVGLGLALAATTLVFLAGATQRSARWLLLPLLSLLLFSTSRVTVFTFGEPALQYGLSQLAVAIGAYALARWRERPIALALALAFGGILASWSWGGGVMAWPVFAIALFTLRVRSRGAWAIFLGGGAVGIAQYVWLLLFHAPSSSSANLARALRLRPVFDLLGRPFVNGIGSNFSPNHAGEIVGLAGLVTLAMLLLIRRGREWSARGPALVLASWSILVAAQIVTFRSDAPPWYACPMALFWAGILMLLAAAPAPIRAGGILVVALLTLRVQRTWEDKSFYLPSRAPVSASCLREWRTAPPACHARVFQWGDEGRLGELAVLGDPLERYHFSVFGASRTYLLQGDVPLGRVRLDPTSAPSFFSRDGKTPGNIDDFHRLDLVLSPGSTVTWSVDLPPDTRTARFRTVVRTDADESFSARGAAVSASAGPDGPTIASRVFLPRGEKRALVLDLFPLAGRTVKVSLGAEETQTPGAPLLWEAPRIELALERTK